MKSLKKVLALTSVVAMLGSYAAGAASVTIANKDENGYIGNVASGNIAIDYTYTPDAGTTGNQVTIIAFEDNGEVALDKEVPFAEGFDVAYINQIASDDVAEGETTVDGNFTFAMRNGLVDLANGEYFNVFVGGTNVATADRATFSYGTIATDDDTTYRIAGTVDNVVNWGEDDEDCIQLTQDSAMVIYVYDENWDEAIHTYNVPIDEVSTDDCIGTVNYEIDYDFEIGKCYYLEVVRAGLCTKSIAIMDTVEADVTCDLELVATDVSEDWAIDATDIGIVVAASNAEAYMDVTTDTNYDWVTDSTDIGIVVANANAFDYDTYHGIVIE